jgi:excinuclease ABC subunit C
MTERKQSTREKLQSLPQKPGVYLMRSKKEEIIYIGKASSLRNRVRSYFQSSVPLSPRLNTLRRKIADFNYIVTDSEVEALILEANLIKQHKPRYNVNLKDDKKYPYIAISKEPYPRIYVTRKLKDDGTEYFGPYTDVKAMRRTLKTLRRIIPMRSCRWDLPGHHPPRACLNFQIRHCTGPCQGLISIQDYARLVGEARLFLKGRSDELVKALQEKMEEASRKLKFELAAQFRDRLADLQSVLVRQKVFTLKKEDRDIISIAREQNDAIGVVMEVRGGKLLDRKHHHLDGVDGFSKEEMLSAFVRQFYLDAVSVPPEIHLPLQIEDESATATWLSQKRGEKVKLCVPQRGNKAKLVNMVTKNAELLLTEWQLKRERTLPHSVAALQKDLKLSVPPRRIEAIDISNIGGTDAVGSLVYFQDGRAKKSEYRRFKIKTVKGQDDFAMVKEVVQRRFRGLKEQSQPLPDLLVVDGGKGQLSSAVAALGELEISNQPVIGLAKKLEEVFLPGLSDPQNIPKISASLKLLQAVRDEAHRFAVSYHRKLRGKKISRSVLDQIPGVGPARKAALLKNFGSVKQLGQASVEQIAQVRGVNLPLAQITKERLNNA